MSIPEYHKKNFETLLRTVANDDVALMQCTDKTTGEDVTVICAVQTDGEEFVFAPFAKMFDGNPYDQVEPPAATVESA